MEQKNTVVTANNITLNHYSLTENPWKLFGLSWFQLSILLITIVMAAMSFGHGITGDDIVVNEYGKAIIRYIVSFGADDYVFKIPKAIDRDLIIQNYGGLFSVICALFNKISPFAEYTTIHFFNALSGALATYFAGKVAQRYFGQGAAIVTMWLMFLAPFWLGNAMNNPKDTPFAALFFAAIYYILVAIETDGTAFATRKIAGINLKLIAHAATIIASICMLVYIKSVNGYLPELQEGMDQYQKNKMILENVDATIIKGLFYICLIPIAFYHFTVTRKQFLLPILFIAFAINVRVGGILLIPYFVAYMVGNNIWRKYFNGEKVSFVDNIIHVIGASILAYILASFFWPYSYQNPMYNPLDALSELTHIRVGLNQIFDGTKMMSGVSDPETGVLVSNFPKSYLIKCIGYTSPWVILVGFCAALPIAMLLHKKKTDYKFVIVLFMLFATLFPIVYIIYKKSNVYHLWRHTLFIFPSMMVLVGYAYHTVATAFNSKAVKYGVIALVALLSLEPLYFIVKTYPNTMSYFNSMVGGVKGAYANYEVDFYFNIVKETTDWFKKN